MVKKATSLSLCMLICMLFSVMSTSCSKDEKNEPNPDPAPTQSSPIVGTWTHNETNGSQYDDYTLVFNDNNTGYIRNEFGTRTSVVKVMNFDWSLTMTSNGYYLLSVIYKSGDREMDGPFSGGYAQYNSLVTIAGNTLSISTDGDTVFLLYR